MVKKGFKRIQLLLARALKQGWSVERLSWAGAWGGTVGVFPIYGVTTPALAVVGWVGKLNHAVLQAFNYMMGPLKLLLILPYIRLGEVLFRADDPFRLSIPEFADRFHAAPLETLQRFSMTFVHASVGWLLTAPLWMLALFLLMKTVLGSKRLSQIPLEEKTI